MQFEIHQVPDPAAGVEHQAERWLRLERLAAARFLAAVVARRPDPDLSEQVAAAEVPSPALPDSHGNVPLPTSQSKNRRIETRARLTLATACRSISMQIIAEVSHVPVVTLFTVKSSPFGVGEPADEFSQVVADRSTGVRREIVGSEIACHQRRLPRPDKQSGENIIAPILAALWTRIRTPFGHSFCLTGLIMALIAPILCAN